MFAGQLAEVDTNSKIFTTGHLRYRVYPVFVCLQINAELVPKFQIGTAYFSFSFPYSYLPK